MEHFSVYRLIFILKIIMLTGQRELSFLFYTKQRHFSASICIIRVCQRPSQCMFFSIVCYTVMPVGQIVCLSFPDLHPGLSTRTSCIHPPPHISNTVTTMNAWPQITLQLVVVWIKWWIQIKMFQIVTSLPMDHKKCCLLYYLTTTCIWKCIWTFFAYLS